jgi:hypothetical protein
MIKLITKLATMIINIMANSGLSPPTTDPI